MKRVPGFLSQLQESLESLPLDLIERINRPGGLEISDLIDHLLKPRDNSIYEPSDVVSDRICKLSSVSNDEDPFKDGRVAYCILAGAVDEDQQPVALKKFVTSQFTPIQSGLSRSMDLPEVWVMTNPLHHERVESHVAEFKNVKCFKQYETVRLTPDNQLFNSQLSPCGSGDLIPALIDSGMLQRFIQSGGRHVQVVDVTNLASRPRRDLVDAHVSSGRPITVEVMNKRFDDRGHTLCDHQGFDIACEDSRIDGPTRANQFSWTCTGTMVIDANLDWSRVEWDWVRSKRISRGSLVVQYERSIYDITRFFKTNFVEIERKDGYVPLTQFMTFDEHKNIQ